MTGDDSLSAAEAVAYARGWADCKARVIAALTDIAVAPAAAVKRPAPGPRPLTKTMESVWRAIVMLTDAGIVPVSSAIIGKSGVAKGSMGWCLDSLEKRGFILRHGTGYYILKRPDDQPGKIDVPEPGALVGRHEAKIPEPRANSRQPAGGDAAPEPDEDDSRPLVLTAADISQFRRDWREGVTLNALALKYYGSAGQILRLADQLALAPRVGA